MVGFQYCIVDLDVTIAERLVNQGKLQVVNVESTIFSSTLASINEASLKLFDSDHGIYVAHRLISSFMRFWV